MREAKVIVFKLSIMEKLRMEIAQRQQNYALGIFIKMISLR